MTPTTMKRKKSDTRGAIRTPATLRDPISCGVGTRRRYPVEFVASRARCAAAGRADRDDADRIDADRVDADRVDADRVEADRVVVERVAAARVVRATVVASPAASR
jgi:hypothetical protein